MRSRRLDYGRQATFSSSDKCPFHPKGAKSARNLFVGFVLSRFTTIECAALMVVLCLLATLPSGANSKLDALLKEEPSLNSGSQKRQSKDYKAALSDYEAAFKRAPAKSKAKSRAALALAETTRNQNEAYNFIGMGYPKMVREKFEKALAESSDSGDSEAAAAARFQLGLFEWSYDRFEQATSEFQKIVDTYSTTSFAPDALLASGMVAADFYRRDKQEATAGKYFDRVIAESPSATAAVGAYWQRGMQWVRKRSDAKAIVELRKAVELIRQPALDADPDAWDFAAEAYYEMGMALSRQKNFKEAQKSFDELTQGYKGTRTTHPTGKRVFLQAPIQSALCQILQGKKSQGIRALEQFIANHPKDFLALRAQELIDRYQAPGNRVAQRKSGGGRVAQQKPPANPRKQPVISYKPAPTKPGTSTGKVQATNATRHSPDTCIACGPAALAVVCKLYGIPATESELAKLARTEKKYGTSLYALYHAAEQKGLHPVPLRVHTNGLAQQPVRTDQSVHLHDLRLPAILHLITNHYVVLVTMDDQTAELHDPSAPQHYRLTLDELGKQCTGAALVFDAEFENQPSLKTAQLPDTGQSSETQPISPPDIRPSTLVAQSLLSQAVLSPSEMKALWGGQFG